MKDEKNISLQRSRIQSLTRHTHSTDKLTEINTGTEGVQLNFNILSILETVWRVEKIL